MLIRNSPSSNTCYVILPGSIVLLQELAVATGVTRTDPDQRDRGSSGSYEAIQGPALVFDIDNIDDFEF